MKNSFQAKDLGANWLTVVKLNLHSLFHMQTDYSIASRPSGLDKVLHKYRNIFKDEQDTLKGVSA